MLTGFMYPMNLSVVQVATDINSSASTPAMPGTHCGNVNMGNSSVYGVIGDFCKNNENKFRPEEVENAEVIGIDTYLLRNSYGEEDDPNANNEYELTFEVKPNLVFWLNPKDFE